MFFRLLDDERQGRGSGPTAHQCLLYTGHTGISTDEDDPRVIYGFNPRIGNVPIWQAMDVLGAGGAYPGEVRDDSAVFAAAQQQRLTGLSYGIEFSPASFAAFLSRLNAERDDGSQFTYGFPDGDGDCNCTTWIERLGLPLLTGLISEFTVVTGVLAQLPRRFGVCT
jgi:hypothetical protein